MPVNWVDLIQNGAQIAGAAAAARAQGRQAESQALNQRDQSANSIYATQQNAQNQAGQLDLQRQLAAQNMAGQRTKQAVGGDLLSRMQDVSINIPGIQTASVTGGLRPSAMGDVGRTSSALLAKQALMKQLEGDSFQGGQVLTPPTQSAMPKSNALDSILQYGGLGGALAGAVGGAMGQGGPRGEVWGGAPQDEGAVAGAGNTADPEVLNRIIASLMQQGGGATGEY